MVYSRGVTCRGASSNAVVVTCGKIIGQTARGTVSPDGKVHGTSTGNGITVITTGRLSGRSGGGTFARSPDAGVPPNNGKTPAFSRV